MDNLPLNASEVTPAWYSEELLREIETFEKLTSLSTKSSIHSSSSSLSATAQLKVLGRMKMINQLLSSSIHLLGSHKGHFYLRTALKKFGWRVPAEIYDSLGENDTIEVYGTDLTLRVANLRFVEVCSYSLEDVLQHEFYELFDRDEKIATHLVSSAHAMFGGKTEIQYELGPDHVVSEKFSDERRKFWVKSRFLSPVFDNSDRVVGVLYSATVELLQNIEQTKPQTDS